MTLTCPSYGRVCEDGTPADPEPTTTAGPPGDALHFAALFDRFIQNLRRLVGYDLQYFAAIEPQRRLAPQWSGKTLADHRADRQDLADRDARTSKPTRAATPGSRSNRVTRTTCPTANGSCTSSLTASNGRPHSTGPSQSGRGRPSGQQAGRHEHPRARDARL